MLPEIYMKVHTYTFSGDDFLFCRLSAVGGNGSLVGAVGVGVVISPESALDFLHFEVAPHSVTVLQLVVHTCLYDDLKHAHDIMRLKI